MSDQQHRAPSGPKPSSGPDSETVGAAAPESTASLDELRAHINQVDDQLVRLLNERAGLSLAVGAYKAARNEPVHRPFREEALLERLARESHGPLRENQLRAVYREILALSRQLQSPQRIACLGPAGTFSHLAGLAFLGRNADFELQANLVDVFNAVSEGDCALAVSPLENSLHGSVGQCLDLFLTHPVHITAEFFYRIRHALLSRETDLAKIKTVFSHPQGLAQCGEWLRRNLPAAEAISVDSTAKAAHLAAENSHSAAVAHADLAQELGLLVLAQSIADQNHNHTRFVLLAPGRLENGAALPADMPSHGQPAKTSLLFTLPDRPGALAAILGILAQAQINLSKLESRPGKGEDWAYVFFADVAVNLMGAAYERILRDLKRNAHELRILGVYPPGSVLADNGEGKTTRVTDP